MIVTNAIPARSINVSSVDFDCVFMEGPQGLLPGKSISSEIAGGIAGGEFNPDKGLIEDGEFKGSFMVTAVADTLTPDGTGHATTTMAVSDVFLRTVPGDVEDAGPFYQVGFTATNVGNAAIRGFTVWLTAIKQ